MAFGDIDSKGLDSFYEPQKDKGWLAKTSYMHERKEPIDKYGAEYINESLGEQKNLWVDIGQAQSVAMGNLISGWTSALSLFKEANSALEIMIDKLVQIAAQQIVLAGIDYVGGAISSAVSSVVPSAPSTPSAGGVGKATNALLIQNNELQKQILDKKQESKIQGKDILISYDKSNKVKTRYT